MVHTYDDEWTLTGLVVHEEHGAKTAVVYEDPAIDDDLKDDAALWALSHVLDQRLIDGIDNDGNGNARHQRR